MREDQSLNDMFTLAYDELRRLAQLVSRDDGQKTLTPTALVNEAWLKMARSPELAGVSMLHFKRIAARAMRQVLVEAARRRNSQKRGAGYQIVTWDEAAEGVRGVAGDVLALDAALKKLSRLSPRQATMIEARFFGGLNVRETAEALGISEATVLRDWRVAKAFLARELSGASPRSSP